MRRQVAIRGRRDRGEDRAPLAGRERIGRLMMRAVPRIRRVRVGAPPFDRAYAEPEQLTRRTTARAGLDGRLEEGPNHRARLGPMGSSASRQIAWTFVSAPGAPPSPPARHPSGGARARARERAARRLSVVGDARHHSGPLPRPPARRSGRPRATTFRHTPPLAPVVD